MGQQHDFYLVQSGNLVPRVALWRGFLACFQQPSLLRPANLDSSDRYCSHFLGSQPSRMHFSIQLTTRILKSHNCLGRQSRWLLRHQCLCIIDIESQFPMSTVADRVPFVLLITSVRISLEGRPFHWVFREIQYPEKHFNKPSQWGGVCTSLPATPYLVVG